ncbi:AI-2E family transporter [Rhodoblastus sp. 17X3]|uniref:AI-2E family transporter n=1 Tax=Rhodoblastus sp. 17X3 TaxID=3047026 RepID=UPI0024B70AD5|nr:AI-2E family transporter [Rhodoblastus sp. 17X3]MDI9849920.1 AI-2E family transporter [Rhodoblastus sp. 17X3]
MADNDRAMETNTEAESPPEMPLPSEPQVIFLGGLFALAVLTAAYAAREIVLPLAFAITLKLLLQPVMRLVERARLPRAVASLLIILALLARSFADGLFTTVLFLYFLLLSGDSFLRRLVEILPRFGAKRQAIDISQQIESDISAYLETITVMNLAVGLATALVMHLTGVGDPILWGTFAFLLNYAPIIGPALCTFVFLLAGLLTIDGLWAALAPAGLYLTIHIIEGETLTPMLLARRFTLNPVLVILSLVFWFWMWGIPGAILSVPMLAITKIICDRIRPFAALGHFLSG